MTSLKDMKPIWNRNTHILQRKTIQNKILMEICMYNVQQNEIFFYNYKLY